MWLLIGAQYSLSYTNVKLKIAIDLKIIFGHSGNSTACTRFSPVATSSPCGGMLVRARRQGMFFPSGSSKLPGAKPMTRQELDEKVIAERNAQAAKASQDFTIVAQDDEKERIRRQNPIQLYVRTRGVELKRQGKMLLGICPLPGCDDSSGHFYVDPEEQWFKCHKCN